MSLSRQSARHVPSASAQHSPRGVWVAPFLGPDGETVLVAVSSDRRIVGELVFVPPGAGHVFAADALWLRLERADPVAILTAV